MTAFTTSAPARLCLFGEHQDYLGLPVMAMAINRRCRLDWAPREDTTVRLTSESLGTVMQLDMASLNFDQPAHPWEAVLAQFMRETGVQPKGMDVHIQSDIPIQAGCSSSTALITAWAAGWGRIWGKEESLANLANRCHKAEVLAFQGAGGNMDHLACAHGHFHRFGQGAPQPLPPLKGAFVLGDSGEPKDTQGHLARCKEARLPLMPHLDAGHSNWSEDQRQLAEGTRVNRDLEAAWAARLELGDTEDAAFGADLVRHHEVLRDVLGLSTPKIEAMLDAATKAGAWGGKINGSGGGGCMLAYTPADQAEVVAQAVRDAGAKNAWVVSMDEGVRHD